ncbi:hypothetical protein [Aurantibacillus circumpalustris]|uniref:hypothetical protein n=1 Tax=Aurantibacillus circumpalustris TaxID=3036359 RepID=UPI00295B4C3D|nr:hypothetical protein [Aurantibacillus circumpalustris]
MKVTMNRIGKNIFFILCYIMTGCNHNLDNLSPREYVRFLSSQESGLSQTKTIDDIKFKCKLQIPSLITLLSSAATYTSKEQFDTEKDYHKNQLTVVFLIEDDSHLNHRVKETIFKTDLYSKLISYSNNELQKDFALQLSNGEIVPCGFVHLEAANSVAPIIRISATFYNNKSDMDDCTIIFDDNIFNSGRIKFHYNSKIFNNLPTLKI